MFQFVQIDRYFPFKSQTIKQDINEHTYVHLYESNLTQMSIQLIHDETLFYPIILVNQKINSILFNKKVKLIQFNIFLSMANYYFN